MKVLIVAALDKEIDILNDLLKAKKKKDYYFKKIGKSEIYTSTIGVGTINALTNTQSLIEEINPDFVINIGTAGSFVLEVDAGDIVVCDEAIYHGGYILTNSPCSDWETLKETNLSIKGDKKLSKLLDKIDIGCAIYHGKTLSGDFFTKDLKTISALREKYHNLCEDMETLAIYKACEIKKIPCIAYRIISNNEIKGSKYEDNVLSVNKKLQEVIFDLLEHLD